MEVTKPDMSMPQIINNIINNIGLSFLLGYKDTLLGTEFEVSKGYSLGKRKKALKALFASMGIKEYKILQLPDVSKFSINLGLLSGLLLAYGLVRRMTSVISLERHVNRKYNKYLLHMYLRSLYHLQGGEMDKFWKLWTLLLRRSNVYMIVCLQQIDKNLYRTKTLRELDQILRRVNKLRRNLSNEIEYRRVYIPKASSGSFAEVDRHTFRPLGVPSLPWRIYLNMQEHPLVLSAPLNESQHGFRPKRGTLTAWVEMFQKVVDSPNIYEIDLKQCFPSINLLRLEWLLINKYHYPKKVAKFLVSSNYASPEFKGDLKNNETQFLLLNKFSLKNQKMQQAKEAQYGQLWHPVKDNVKIQ